MVDHYQTVCAMCGDVGFPDKLFRCSKYCSNYYYNYSEQSDPIQVCDWCQSEQRRWNHGGGGGAHSRSDSGTNRPSEYSGDKIKQRDREEGMEKSGGKNPAASTSLPRTATRRYKLLKDVMC
nr:zinc ion-binding protein [Ipomoea batatas]GMC84858.1 zinc ion-binding protein [Ipomoea batatas]GME21380.1 zinc ion-binding protein [Ipomoea batatas]GME21381.1 zinc ion-binding protein [Ipomoea batatas]